MRNLFARIVIIQILFFANAFAQETPPSAAARTQAEIQVLKGQKKVILQCGDRARYSPKDPTAQLAATEVKDTGVQVTGAIPSCTNAASIARIACIEALNPHLKTAMGAVGAITATVGGVVSLSNSCSKMGEALKYANIGLTAYNTACAAAMMACKSSCGKLVTQAKAGEQTVTSKATGCKDLNKDQLDLQKVLHASQTVETSCKKYTLNMVAAGAGILAMITQFGLASKCEDKTKDCKENSFDPRCPPKAVDCSIDTNLTKIECICQVRPNTPGCVGAGGTRPGDTYSRSNPETTKGIVGPTGIPEGAGLFENDDKRKTQQGFSSGGASGGAADSGSGGNGFGGGGASPGAKKEAGKGLNANILGGEAGGGGGGGGSGGSSGGYADLDANSQYKAYIPGGANDPSRGLAGGEAAFSSQVTGGGGKSNFEKIRDRYRDNKSSLLDQ